MVYLQLILNLAPIPECLIIQKSQIITVSHF